MAKYSKKTQEKILRGARIWWYNKQSGYGLFETNKI